MARPWVPSDDGILEDKNYGDDGPPILFTNPEIRTMLRLAGARRNDVFYDLGSGWGQNLIIAASEFRVRKCVGIEWRKLRAQRAIKRVKSRSLTEMIRVVHGNFERLLRGSLGDADISEATIVHYSLSSDSEFIHKLSRRVRDRCRLVYSYRCLIPEIKPLRVDYPFYMSKSPFKTPKSEVDWLTSVLGRRQQSDEMWNELYHDYVVNWRPKDALEDIHDYRKRLRAVLRKRR